MAMFPSLVSKHFVKGSVVKIRKPFEVPGAYQKEFIMDEDKGDPPTAKWL